jgi:hypothetical protein
MGPFRLTALVLAASLAGGCGQILDEIDHANEIAGKPGGGNLKGKPAPGQKSSAPEEASGPGLLARVEGWLGLGEKDERAGRAPRDPNDPMVICRLGPSTAFMLKSSCLNRKGTVVADKGAQR